MTSPTSIGTELLLPGGRTVRDIVEYSPELVNEVWCRKILRQVLQALEHYYDKQLPHPAITADSIAMQGNGDATLLASATRPVDKPSEPDDLHALARVIHYAITTELAPAGPLRGRAPEGYSDSLINAIDRCMAADLSQRPQTIEQLRSLLGIVAVGAPLPQKSSAPVPARQPVAPVAKPAAPAAPLQRASAPGEWQRWLLIAAAASVVVAGGFGLYALLRDRAPDDKVALALPPAATANKATAQAAPPGNTEDLRLVMADGTKAPVPHEAPQEVSQEPTAVAPAATDPAANGADTPPATGASEAPLMTSYKLVIKPWGTVYVNGVERGVSPPLKRLVLPAGKHTIRIVNPNFPDRVIKLATGKSRTGRISHTFSGSSR